MSLRTVLFFWGVFLLLHLLDSVGRDTISSRALYEQQLNVSFSLGNMSWPANATRFDEIGTMLDNLFLQSSSIDPDEPAPVFYQNLTGIMKGKWTHLNLTYNDIPHAAYYNETEARRLLAGFTFSKRHSGVLSFHLQSNNSVLMNVSHKDSELSDVRFIDGFVKVGHPRGGLLLSVHGAHFVRTGEVFLVGSAAGNGSSLTTIPAMMLSKESFEYAKGLALGVNAENLRYLRNRIASDPSSEEDVESLQSRTACVFYIFMQLRHLPRPFSWEDIQAYEEELLHPQGIPTRKPPRLQSNAILYSPTCGVVLSSTDNTIRGLKLEQYHAKSATYTVVVWIISCLELFLTMRQMQFTTTPSALSKVSVVTVGMLTCLDAYLCLFHFASGGAIPTLFLPFVTAAFFKFLLFSIFEMRYLLDVTRAQRRNSTDFAIGAMYSRFCTYMVVGVFLFFQFGAQSPTIVAITGFVMNSFWVPQIVSNIRRNSRGALDPYYLFGMSLLRLILPLYYYGCPRNVVHYEEVKPFGASVLVMWMAAQVILLVLQDRFGPRVFVPSLLRPVQYDYHPVLTATDIEQSTLIAPSVADATATSSTAVSLRRNECAICFTSVIPVTAGATASSSSSSSSSKSPVDSVLSSNVSRMSYMVTPCHHLFHTECLEKWMEVKFECPVCRTELPENN
ncbi:hypothetical protein DFJ73DRAFT_868710 [Zopfochytrium polystomum]|nr:hypothetical protein DFJ73DRAFT_868710 [Zopfochytrium polystomum]